MRDWQLGQAYEEYVLSTPAIHRLLRMPGCLALMQGTQYFTIGQSLVLRIQGVLPVYGSTSNWQIDGKLSSDRHFIHWWPSAHVTSGRLDSAGNHSLVICCSPP